MDRLDMAKIFAEQQAEPKETATTTTVTALATSDSVDGTVYVDMGGVTISGDDSQSVPIATTVAVKKGDTVRVELLGADGKAKTPTVTGVIGGGDRVQKAVDEAGETAQQASQTAEQAGMAAGQASIDAAKAKAAADAAQEASKKLETLIRQTSDGLTVGKSADGETYAGPYVQIGSDGTVRIKDKGGASLADFTKDMIAFGASTVGQKIRFCGGHGELSYHGEQIWLAGKSVMLVPIDPTGIKSGDNYIGYASEDRLEMQCQGQYHIGNAFFTSADFTGLKESIQTDYVIGQYLGPERKSWSWRKWASGLCEQWVIATVNSASGWQRVGSTEIWKYGDYRTLQIKLTALEDVHLDTDWDGWVTSDSENPNLDSLGRVYFTLYQPTGSDGLDKKHTVRVYVRGRYK